MPINFNIPATTPPDLSVVSHINNNGFPSNDASFECCQNQSKSSSDDSLKV